MCSETSYPEGYQGPHGRMLPDEFSFSMFPDAEEQTDEEELTEEEQESAEEFLKALEDLTEDEIETIEDLERALSENQDIMEEEHFEEDYEQAVRYLEFMQKVKDAYTAEELAEKNHYDLAKELGYKSAEVSWWITRGDKPSLIKRIEKREGLKRAKKILTEMQKTRLRELAERPPELWSESDFRWLLKQYPKLMKHPKYQERYRKLLAWLELMQRQRDGDVSEKPDREELKKWASRLGVSIPSIQDWLIRKSIPFLARLLTRRVKKATHTGSVKIVRGGLPRVEKHEPANRVGELQVKESFTTCKDSSSEELAKAISGILSLQQSLVSCADIPSKYVKDLTKKLDSVEQRVNSLLGYDRDETLRLRLAMIKNRLYMRHQNTSPLELRNLLGKELFYFKGESRLELLDEAFRRLGIVSRKKFAVLVRRLTDFGPLDHMPAGGTNQDLQTRARYLQGETVDLILDVLGKDLKDIEDSVDRLGKSYGNAWQIRNPRFLEKDQFLIWAARVVSIIASDGNIGYGDFKLTYWEKIEHRAKRVRNLFNEIGDTRIILVKGESGTQGYQYAPILGRLLHRLGVPKGDKVLQGMTLPDFIKNGSDEIKCAYLRELIPEEGSITFTKEWNAKIAWGRTVILYDENKEHLYGKIEKITTQHIKLIKRDDISSYEKKRECFRVPTGKLRDLMNTTDPEIAKLATQLYNIVMSNPPSLMEDEKELCASLGISSSRHLSYVRYYVKSGRVSSHFETAVASLKDVARWSLIAPPNDRRKAKLLADWVAKKLDDVFEELAVFALPSGEEVDIGVINRKNEDCPD